MNWRKELKYKYFWSADSAGKRKDSYAYSGADDGEGEGGLMGALSTTELVMTVVIPALEQITF